MAKEKGSENPPPHTHTQNTKNRATGALEPRGARRRQSHTAGNRHKCRQARTAGRLVVIVPIPHLVLGPQQAPQDGGWAVREREDEPEVVQGLVTDRCTHRRVKVVTEGGTRCFLRDHLEDDPRLERSESGTRDETIGRAQRSRDAAKSHSPGVPARVGDDVLQLIFADRRDARRRLLGVRGGARGAPALPSCEMPTKRGAKPATSTGHQEDDHPSFNGT